MLAGSALLGLSARRWLGAGAVARQGPKIDGFNVLVLFVFVAAVMGNLGHEFLRHPGRVAALTGLAFAVFLLLLLSTLGLFLFAGRGRALALGLAVAQRNLGLVLAAAGGLLPETAWLYFALCQFPIYLSPQILAPLARRWAGGGKP